MLMLYFSGTGNSQYIADEFAAKMGCACHSIEENVDFAALLAATDTVAVCYPVYGSCVPRLMRDWVARHAVAMGGKRLVILCTQMMFSGDGARAFARLLPDCDSHVIYAEHFAMPNNISNFWLFPVRDGERRRKKRAADKRLARVCNDIRQGTIKRRGWCRLATMLGKVQNSSWYAVEEKRKGSFVADSDCNRCGLCARCCPVQNLTCTADGIEQHDRCMLCYRCVNQCPRRAAMVLLHTSPKQQYRGIVPDLD